MSNKELIYEKVIGKIKFVGDDSFHLYEWVDSSIRKASVTTIIGILEKPALYDYIIKKTFEYLERIGFQSINPLNRESTIRGAINERVRLLKDASDNVGTPVHDTIEKYIHEWIDTGNLPTDITNFLTKKEVYDKERNITVDKTDPRVYAGIRSAENWFRKMSDKITPLFYEIIVGNPKYSAGRIDFVFEFNDTKEIGIMDWKTSNYVYDSQAMQQSAYASFLSEMIGKVVKKVYIAHLSKDKDEYEIYKVKNIKDNYLAFRRLADVYEWSFNRKDKFVKDITTYDARGKKHTRELREC